MRETASYSFTADWVTAKAESWRAWLAPHAGRPEIRLLEIGSYEGRSAVWFLENVLTHPSARLTCVDLFSEADYETRFDDNLRLSGFASKVSKIKSASHEALWPLAPKSFDIVYIDGSHEAADVLMDAVASFRALKIGGTMIFDDYLWKTHLPERNRPKIAVDLFVDLMGRSCELLGRPAAQACLRRRQ